MCYATTCSTCGKTTWAGCGHHVADVQKNVPDAQWCPGHPDGAAERGFLARIFAR